MKVLVTGGAGYIGSHTVRQLLSSGHQVVIVDNLSTGYRSLVPESVPLVVGNAGDAEAFEAALSYGPVDAIIHFAASIEVEESVRDPIKYYRNNFEQTRGLVQLALQKNVNRFIFSSTAAVYQAQDGKAITESDVIAPISPYGQSKAVCERFLLDVAAAYPNFQPVIFRYFNVAGARVDSTIGQISKNATHLIKVLSETATGKRPGLEIFGSDYPTKDGTAERDYIHVEDIASAHVLGLTTQISKSTSPIFNLGYGKTYSVNEIVSTFNKISKNPINAKYAPRRPGDMSSVKADPTRALKMLNWVPEYNSIDLICETALRWETNCSAAYD